MYDYIIAGGGPAGCVLANRLSEDPGVNVLLLEAGNPDRHPYFRMPGGFAKLTGTMGTWGYETVPQKGLNGKKVWYPQGKVLGGGTSINAQVYTRGHPLDFDEWAEECGCAGWAFKDILPYYRKLEDNPRFVNEYHGQGGPFRVSDPVPHPLTLAYVRAAQQAGIPYNPDFNGEKQEGIGIYQVTNRDGMRTSGASAYIDPVRHRKNLTVKTKALTTKVLIENGKAVGVEYVEGNSSNPQSARCEREVLVTAGAVGSPKLLMLSGIGRKDELAEAGVESVHDLPGVGENFQDHMDIFAITECSGDYSFDVYKAFHMQIWAGLQYIFYRTGPVASNLCDGGGFWYADPEARSPDVQFHFLPGSGLEEGVEKIRNGVTSNSAFLRPRSRGSVKLKSSNPREMPLIDPNYWGDPYDREMSIKAFRLVREIMRQPAFEPFMKGEIMPGPDVQTDDDIANYTYKFAKTDYHPVGACKMGVDDMAVVDTALKVHGMEGLRVCDSSVMPRVNSSNTMAPTIMIAEKAADHILGKIK
ncbi:MAG: GMC family oxidoreductase N-terminal domain-containing protein [Rhodospirillales bacterium]|nr:GMC family oxidoreductase N-terminal domain-containing protein [Rhodospirillales bacterium]